MASNHDWEVRVGHGYERKPHSAGYYWRNMSNTRNALRQTQKAGAIDCVWLILLILLFQMRCYLLSGNGSSCIRVMCPCFLSGNSSARTASNMGFGTLWLGEYALSWLRFELLVNMCAILNRRSFDSWFCFKNVSSLLFSFFAVPYIQSPFPCLFVFFNPRAATQNDKAILPIWAAGVSTSIQPPTLRIWVSCGIQANKITSRETYGGKKGVKDRRQKIM